MLIFVLARGAGDAFRELFLEFVVLFEALGRSEISGPAAEGGARTGAWMAAG